LVFLSPSFPPFLIEIKGVGRKRKGKRAIAAVLFALVKVHHAKEKGGEEKKRGKTERGRNPYCFPTAVPEEEKAEEGARD